MKKTLSVLFAGLLLVILSSCQKQKESYSMEEFYPIYEKVETKVEEQAQNWNENELYGEKHAKLYGKVSKSENLPFKKQITLKGYKQNSALGGSFYICTKDSDERVMCYLPEKHKGEIFFINDGSKIEVSGVFSKDSKSFGVMSDVAIKTPTPTVEYKSNIDEILDEKNLDSPVSAIGEVIQVTDLKSFEGPIKTLQSEYFFDDYSFDYPHQETVVCLKGENGKTIYFMCRSEESVKVGDKVAVSGNLEKGMVVKKADGSTELFSGNLNNVFNVFFFK